MLCDNIRQFGACTDDGCPSNHDFRICQICQVLCPTDFHYAAHLQGKRHRTVTRGNNQDLFCPICQRNIKGRNQWEQHIAGTPHRLIAEAQGESINVEPQTPVETPDIRHCELCDRGVSINRWKGHLASPLHTKKVFVASFLAAYSEAEKDKHCVTVSGGETKVDFGIVEIFEARESVQQKVVVELTAPNRHLTIIDVRMAKRNCGYTNSSFKPHFDGTMALAHGRAISIPVTFSQEFIGRYEDRLEIILEDTSLRQKFMIVRAVCATVGSRADHALLQVVTPYRRLRRSEHAAVRAVVRGVRPAAHNAIPYVGKLPQAAISDTLARAISNGTVSEVVAKVKSMFLPQKLDVHSYARHFCCLLHIEEDRTSRDLQQYDIHGAELQTYGKFFYVPVPGLAEKRPSVLIGDRILVRNEAQVDREKWFEGFVHVVRQAEVGLCLNAAFSKTFSAAHRYAIRFMLNRIPVKRQHQALNIEFREDRLLFPIPSHIANDAPLSALQIRSVMPVNLNIANNAHQLQAVVSIVHQPPRSVPFIVFGPPGTGKTVTIVEAMIQLLKRDPRVRILACAPSNSAADLIADKLRHLGPSQLFRLYAPYRQRIQVSDELMEFACYRDGHFSLDRSRIETFRVIVTTCVSASIALGVGMQPGHFSHIFVDEAGQATEPEVMIAIKTMGHLKTNVVLAGDPKQLGPIVRSAVARELGYQTSFLERLMEREVYTAQRAEGLRSPIVTLTQNYRSHEAILKFPNDSFYGGQLEACGDRKRLDWLLHSSQLVKKDFPIVFHATKGKEEQEGSSPSYFNPDEAIQIKNYIESFRSLDRHLGIRDADIGVISPYHAQVQRIRKILKPAFEGVKIGSAEEFQGQERNIILISCVRSSKQTIEHDLKHTLGFVANPRRFNVAITRARSLLVLVGNPEILGLDPLWRSFLNYIYNRGGWKGDPPSWNPEEITDKNDYCAEANLQVAADMNRLMDSLRSLVIDNTMTTSEGEVEHEWEGNVDREWRDVE